MLIAVALLALAGAELLRDVVLVLEVVAATAVLLERAVVLVLMRVEELIANTFTLLTPGQFVGCVTGLPT